MNFLTHHTTTLGDNPLVTIVPVLQTENLKGWLNNFAFATQALADDFKAEWKEKTSLYQNNQRIFLLGLGKQPTFAEVSDAFRSLFFSFKNKNFKQATVQLESSQLLDYQPDTTFWIEAATHGIALSRYEVGLFKTQKTPSLPLSIEIFSPTTDPNAAERAIFKAQATASTQIEMFRLVDAPANRKNARTLAEWAVQSGKQHSYTVTVLDKAQIEQIGLHALLAVNRGSEIPPRFIIMEYRPDTAEKLPKIGLVGKGVTFDTGGLNIKTAGMHFMKSDMGGAAAVLGTMELTAQLRLPVHLVGIVPTTDNCVDANALKPGDVIDSYSGLTIEVMDTDAEGRLILADGLAYLNRNFKPDVMIDLATLTGSAVRTLGYEAGAMFTHNDRLAEQLFDVGLESGEKLWRLPLWDAYKKGLKSDIADVRNLSLSLVAGATEAAKFLEYFTDNHPAWVHLDIAGVAFKESEFTAYKSGTAFGVRLLVAFLQKYMAS